MYYSCTDIMYDGILSYDHVDLALKDDTTFVMYRSYNYDYFVLPLVKYSGTYSVANNTINLKCNNLIDLDITNEKYDKICDYLKQESDPSTYHEYIKNYLRKKK